MRNAADVDLGQIRITDLGLKRWDRETPSLSIAPETALERSRPAPWWLRSYFVDRNGREPDDVRTYYESGDDESGPYQVVFVIRDGLLQEVRGIRSLKHRSAQAAFFYLCR